MAAQKVKKRKKRLSPEEAKAKRVRRRQKAVGVICCLMLITLLVRIGYIKRTYGDEYTRRSFMQVILDKNSTEKEINPNRGVILDRNRQSLASSVRVYNIILDVTILDGEKPETKSATLAALHETLGIPISDLEAYFAKNAAGELIKPNNYCIVARQVDGTKAMALKDLRCVYLEEDTLRQYNDPYLASQVIGFLRGDASWGLENTYNTELSGELGRVFRMYDQDSNPVTENIAAKDGYTLITTLDAGIQRIAQQAVENAARTYDCEYAAMLIMNPNTCEVLGMAEWPSFSLSNPGDYNLFTDPQVAVEWDMMTAEEQLNAMYKAWGNYCISNSFEPGSIFKPIVVAAALEENIIQVDTDMFWCGGSVTVLDKTLNCWHLPGHGSQNVIDVLANSCNVAMVEINKLLGRNLFFKYRSDFGYGEKTGIDLPGEASVSSPLVMYPLSSLNPVELATSSFGQGFNNTAIQAITAFSALINGGNLMKPYIVAQIVDGDGNVVKENKPTVERKVISAATSDFMRVAMQSVVTPTGTGKNAVIEGYNIGGKTGTAQQGDRESGNVTVSFMAYLPVENPEYIALAIIDHPREELSGGASAAPMLREALLEIIQYKNIRPSGEDANLSAIGSVSGSSTLGDYSNMQLSQVTRNLNNMGIDYQVSGSGTIVKSHIPAAGQPVPENTPVFLYLDPESVVESEMTYVPDVTGLTMEQAEAQMADAHLTPITFKDKTDTADDGASSGQPATYNPSGGAEGGGTEGSGDAAVNEAVYEVYKQYPAAGVYIQKGTEVKLKVRVK